MTYLFARQSMSCDGVNDTALALNENHKELMISIKLSD
ncbi:hypothetical protein ymoll0001_19970 [Yersinia mollaretii ATCC 43969]|uniref:Uncharacterized protein n=1 Tax=Yersinia mollaretii (strain ATCC 43969 / DSM 18520 / CIP 103324 / CNY 7263 / WAIP 204) TaxID=349967 RepID=A0ABM9Y5B0_YERMW|nr:hypothetical protein ymoll0001_19970 [Yersinia mollaretii ATCC 43969]